MAGVKTRYGFSGAEGSSDEGPPSQRAARTVIGHETHGPGALYGLASHPEAGPSSRPNAAPNQEPKTGVPEPIDQKEFTEKIPGRSVHSGKSKFPAIARLFGRWTTGGGFVSRSRILDAEDVLSEVPRNLWPSRIAIFVGAAFISFLMALAVMKIGHMGF